jgi:REP element-mobilizing transposase RayT
MGQAANSPGKSQVQASCNTASFVHFGMAFTRRNLPHFSNEEETYFVTYRQAETWSNRAEHVLDRPDVAAIIQGSWFDLEEKIRLYALCIMKDHVHVVFRTKLGFALPDILESHKQYTARRINQLLGRSARFWQQESFDRVVRNGKLESAIAYTLINPVKAGYVSDWRDWPHAYAAPGYQNIEPLMYL